MKSRGLPATTRSCTMVLFGGRCSWQRAIAAGITRPMASGRAPANREMRRVIDCSLAEDRQKRREGRNRPADIVTVQRSEAKGYDGDDRLRRSTAGVELQGMQTI